MATQTLVLKSTDKYSGDNNAYVVRINPNLIYVTAPYVLKLVQATVTATTTNAVTIECSYGTKTGIVDTTTGSISNFVGSTASLSAGITSPVEILCAADSVGEMVSVCFRSAVTGALCTDIQSSVLVFVLTKV